MLKRPRSLTPQPSSTLATTNSSANVLGLSAHTVKRSKADAQFLPNKIATAENAAKADRAPPFIQLTQALMSPVTRPAEGDAVVYWMRMQDLRGQCFRLVYCCNTYTEAGK